MTNENRLEQIGKQWADIKAAEIRKAAQRAEQSQRESNSRRQQVKELSRHIERVCKRFIKSIDWYMSGFMYDSNRNGRWKLSSKSLSHYIPQENTLPNIWLSIEITPNWNDNLYHDGSPDKCCPHHEASFFPVKGIWIMSSKMDIIGPIIDRCVITCGYDFSGAKALNLPSGVYLYGYYLSINDFSEEKLLTIIEDVCSRLLKNSLDTI